MSEKGRVVSRPVSRPVSRIVSRPVRRIVRPTMPPTMIVRVAGLSRTCMINMMGMMRGFMLCGRMCVRRIGPAMTVAAAKSKQHSCAKQQAAKERYIEKEIVPSKKLDHPRYKHTLYVSLGKQS